MKSAFPNLLKAAKKNLVLVGAYAAQSDASAATYDSSFDRKAALKDAQAAVDKADTALNKLLDKAEVEIQGKSFSELSAALKAGGYDSAILDFFSESIAA